MFGSIAQIGYVVRDLETAMDSWVRRGVGPWFVFEHVETDYFRHRGEDSPVDMSIALANSGAVQIELIRQNNDAPSLYREFLDAGREGVQHVAYWTRAYQDLYDRAIAAGLVVGHEGCIGGERGRFAYFDADDPAGSVIEISDVSGHKGKLFAHIAQVAADWDGSDPIRSRGRR